MGYLWVKAFHVIAVIAWMAGLLYLPRLFVYHVDAERGSVQSETFKVMERRLAYAIMTPAMIVSWVLALVLILIYGIGFGSGTIWLHVKLVLVLLLTGYHIYLLRCVASFARDANSCSTRFYRAINEIPTVIMIAIVIFAVVKPF